MIVDKMREERKNNKKTFFLKQDNARWRRLLIAEREVDFSLCSRSLQLFRIFKFIDTDQTSGCSYRRFNPSIIHKNTAQTIKATDILVTCFLCSVSKYKITDIFVDV